MSSQGRTLIQLSLIDSSGDSFHRMRWPGRQLAKMAPEWRVINLDFRAAERFSWGLEADLLVLLHCGYPELLPLIAKRKAFGKKTLIEINDNFYSPQPWNPARRVWSSPMVWRMYESLIEAADGIIVTGPGLAALLQDRAKGKLHILENHYPEELGDFPKKFPSSNGEFCLGWAGSAGHMADLMYVAPVLRELLDENPHLQLHLMGDESTPDFLRVPKHRLRFTPFGPIQSYFKFWETVDLAFVPLLDTPYNRCRSDIKAVEISGKGVLPILQEGIPYRDFIQETSAPTFKNLSELKKLIEKYLSSPERLRGEAEKCFTYVKEKRLGDHRRERMNLYQDMMKDVPPSSYRWSMSEGFHEMAGTPSPSTPTQGTLERVQNLWSQKKSSEALVHLNTEIEKNPHQPELAMAKLRCLEVLKAKELRSEVLRFERQFPEDLRFKLLQIRFCLDAEERLSKWQELLRNVQETPVILQDHFRQPILSLFSAEPLNEGRFLNLAEQWVDMFPLAMEFRLKIAYALEARGNNDSALKHFHWLLQRKREFDEGKSVLEQLPDYVLEVWSAAIDSRIKDSNALNQV
jgi:hypothetical protein